MDFIISYKWLIIANKVMFPLPLFQEEWKYYFSKTAELLVFLPNKKFWLKRFTETKNCLQLEIKDTQKMKAIWYSFMMTQVVVSYSINYPFLFTSFCLPVIYNCVFLICKCQGICHFNLSKGMIEAEVSQNLLCSFFANCSFCNIVLPC